MAELLKGKITVIVSLCSIALGLLVITGWYLNIPQFIQVLPQFAPMQYNTALGFLLSGMGLLTLAKNNHWQSNGVINTFGFMCGLLVILLGGLSLLQYIINADLALDQLFMDAYITVKTSHPGRMAPNTALCFVLTGLAISLFSLNKSLAAIETVSLLILSFSVMALVGYLVGEENAYSWGKLTGMALHTTIGFMGLGLGMIALVLTTRKIVIASVPLWFPGLLCFVVLMLDMLSPLGVAMGVAYIPLVFCAVFFVHAKVAFLFASVVTLLIVLGYLASPISGVEGKVVFANRILSILAVWVVALLVFLQKRTQQQLTYSQQAYDLSWQGAGNGMWDWDLIADKITFSDRFKELLGYKPDEFDDSFEAWENILHKDDQEHTFKALYDHIDEQAPFDVQYRLQTKSGEWRWYVATGHGIWDEDGKALRIAGSLNDITESKRAEKERDNLIAALEKSNDELDNFAYVASHDLKAPLRVIENVSHWLEDDLGDKIDDESKENLFLLRSRVKRMDALLNDLLAYSRIGRKLDDSFTEFLNGSELIQDITLLVDKPEDFTIKASDQFLALRFNKMPLRLILLNLVSNAIKHHDKAIGLIEISVEEKADEYLIYVQDDGPGIDAEYHKKIFKMFQTLQPRDRVEGSGMGLAIAKKHIELYGGSITVNSSEGGGSCFMLSLPKTQVKQHSANLGH